MPQTGKPLGSMVIKLGLDGTKFTDTLKNIQRSLKTQISTMKTNLKVFDSVGTNLDKLEKNYDDLRDTIKLLEKENEKLTEKYKEHIKAGSENTAAAQRLAKQINENVKKQAIYSKQLEQTKSALKDERNGMNDLRDSISRTEKSTQASIDKFKAMGRSLAANKAEYNGLKSIIASRNQLIDKEKQKLQDLIRTKGIDDSATADQRLAIQKLEAEQAQAISRYKKLDSAIGHSSDRMIIFRDNLAKVKESLNNTAGKISTAGQSISGFFSGATLAVGGGLGLATKKAMDFESQMSSVKSVMDPADAAKYGKSLQDLAITMGSKTKYSATEAAQGMEELVKAGVSVHDIMHGGLSGALNLATAGELSLKDAAEIASTALNSFKKDNISVTQAANLLAGAANASATDVGEMKFALSAVSSVASGIGMSFKDTNTALAELAQNGLKGSDAGTSLKTMLLNLSPSTNAAANMMAQLGLATKNTTAAYNWLIDRGIKPASHSSKDVSAGLMKLAKIQAGAGASASKVKKEYQELAKNSGYASSAFYDQNGKLKSLSQISGLLHDRLKNLTEEQRQYALKVMFGTDAIRASNILYEEGSKGADKMAKSISKIKASDVAAQKMKNLKGTIEQLKGSLETAGITIGNALLPALQKITKGVQKAVDWFNNLSPSTQHFLAVGAGATTVGLGIATAMGAMAMAIGGGITAMSQLIGAMRTFSKLKDILKINKMFGGIGPKNAIKLTASLGWDKVKSTLRIIKLSGSKIGSAFKWAGKLGWSGVKKALSAIKIAGKATGKAFLWTGKIALSGSKKAIEGIGTAAKASGRWIRSMTSAAVSFGKTSAIWVGQKLKILAVATAEKVATTATKIWKGIQIGFNAIMSVNPIYLIITAIGLLVAGIIALYKHYKPFRDFVNGIGSSIVKMKNNVSKHVSQMVSGVKSRFNSMKKSAVKYAGDMANQVADKHSWLNKHTNGAARTMFNGLKKTYKSGHTTIENATATFKDLIHGKWSKLGSDVKKTTKSYLGTVKDYYQTGYSSLNKLTGGRLGDMFDKVKSFGKKVTTFFANLPHNIATGIKNGAKAIANAGKSVGNALLKAVGKPVNGVIKGVNWVLDHVGAKKYDLDPWKVPQYAKGTDGHPQDGPMIVGDGKGKNRKELIRFPNGKMFLSPNKPTLMFAPKGTQVVDGDNTNRLMTMSGIPKYAKGIGSWASNVIKGGFDKLKDLGSKIYDYATDPSKLLNTAVSHFTDLSNLSGATLNATKGIVSTLISRAKNKISSLFGEGLAGGKGYSTAKKAILTAMGLTGHTGETDILTNMLKVAKRESGYNSKAINLWDINAIEGHPSKGMFQMIQSTFDAYKVKGHNNIWNPVDEAASAIRYIIARYGRKNGFIRAASGAYENGGIISSPTIALMGEKNKKEMVIPLTNKARSIELMSAALSMLSGNSPSVSSNSNTIDALQKQIDQNSQMINLLTIIANKTLSVIIGDKDIYDANKRYADKKERQTNLAKGILST